MGRVRVRERDYEREDACKKWARQVVRRQRQANGEVREVSAELPGASARSGVFVWSRRARAFVGELDGGPHELRHFSQCTTRARRFATVDEARTFASDVGGGALVMLALAGSASLFVVGSLYLPNS